MASEQGLMGRRCGIVRIADSTPMIEVMEEIPALGDNEVIVQGRRVVVEFGNDDGLTVSRDPASFVHVMRSSIERPVEHEACRVSWKSLVGCVVMAYLEGQ
jgi:hypothetical protein